MIPPFASSQRIPLGGCDCYLLALEDHMLRTGQGHHVGVTILELDENFSSDQFTSAVHQFAASHPILHATLHRGLPGTVPYWKSSSPASIEITEHPSDTPLIPLVESLLSGNWKNFLRFDFFPTKTGTTVLMSWSHLLFDARGVEMTLAEIALLATNPSHTPPIRNSFEVYTPSLKTLSEKFRSVRPFIDRYYELKSSDITSLSTGITRSPISRCRFLHFTESETTQIESRAREITQGIFLMPYFLAATMRAHAAVLLSRGITAGTFHCAIATQGRKRGAHDPIFQNQVAQLFFILKIHQMQSLQMASAILQEQFVSMTKNKVDTAFLTMVNWMRRLPTTIYRRFLEHSAGGHITSLYHAHTGTFLPHTHTFCGATIRNGWHCPSVSLPPGTGAFFSEKNGRLTMSFSYRQDTVSPEEINLLCEHIRADLLGNK